MSDEEIAELRNILSDMILEAEEESEEQENDDVQEPDNGENLNFEYF